MRSNTKVIPMTRQQIRAEIKKIDDNALRLKPSNMSFNEVMKDLQNRKT